MAAISVERIMDRVNLVIDCQDDIEATHVYGMLVSQILDSRRINLRIADKEVAKAE